MMNFKALILILSALSISACGGGAQDSNNPSTTISTTEPSSETTRTISGAGIKGPLAFAQVTLYALDTSATGLYDVLAPLATARTDAYAQIQDLKIPASATAPFVLVIDGNNAIDLNTGRPPVIKTLITIITQDMLTANKPIYATPYTTMAYHMVNRHISSGELDTIHSSHSAASPSNNGDNMLFSFEAENFSTLTNVNEATWRSINIDGSSNETSIQSEKLTEIGFTESNFRAASPRLDFQFTTSSPGTFYIWLRVRAPSSSSNSIYIGLDYPKSNDEQLLSLPMVSNLAWVGGPGSRKLYAPSTGIHTLNIWMREPRVAIDKIVLTTDPNFRPSQNGPDSTPTTSYNIAKDVISVIMEDKSESIIASYGFGVLDDVSIHSTPPVFDNTVVSTKDATNTLNYRAAIEALSTLLHNIHLSEQTYTSDQLLRFLSEDIYIDGTINGSNDDGTAFIDELRKLSINPTRSKIAYTEYTIEDIALLIHDEAALVGLSTSNDVLSYSESLPKVSLNPLPVLVPPSTQTTEMNPIISSGLVASSLVASGPIVIDGERDVIISGLKISNPDGHCIEVKNGSTNIVIENSEIGPCDKRGVFIRDSSDTKVRNNYIHDTGSVGVQIARSERIDVTSNQIDRTKTSIYANQCQSISVTYNSLDTIHGTYTSDGLNAFIQFSGVTGYGNRVNHNSTYTRLGESDVGDDINLFESHGMPDDPIQVNYNTIVGSGPREVGSGIMLGDKGSSYAVAKGNILVNPGGSAIGVAGGHHNTIIDNIVYSQRLDWAGYGVFVRDYYDSNCSNITVQGNTVDWTSKSGAKQGSIDHGNCGDVRGWNENDWDAVVDDSIKNLQ